MFLQVDPLFEKFPDASPYNYCYNSPMTLVDPLGLEALSLTQVNEIEQAFYSEIAFFLDAQNSPMDAGWSGMENTRDYQWDAIRTGSGGSGINGEYTELDVRGHLSEVVDNWEDLKKDEQDALVRSFQYLAENDPVGYGELVKDLKGSKVNVYFKSKEAIPEQANVDNKTSEYTQLLGLFRKSDNEILIADDIKNFKMDRETGWGFPNISETTIYGWQTVIHEFSHKADYFKDPVGYNKSDAELRAYSRNEQDNRKNK